MGDLARLPSPHEGVYYSTGPKMPSRQVGPALGSRGLGAAPILREGEAALQYPATGLMWSSGPWGMNGTGVQGEGRLVARSLGDPMHE
jgi:hypothetical protein